MMTREQGSECETQARQILNDTLILTYDKDILIKTNCFLLYCTVQFVNCTVCFCTHMRARVRFHLM